MASNYGLNFGFLRSSEEVRVAEGRHKVPAAASWVLGTAVEIDPAVPGYLKQSAANAVPVTGYAGLLLQELDMFRGIYESDVNLMDSFQYGLAKPANLAIVTNGAGTKVWYKNTAAQTRADGRVIAARTMFLTTNMAVGAEIGWNGTAWAEAATGKYMKVTAYNATALYFEAVLLK